MYYLMMKHVVSQSLFFSLILLDFGDVVKCVTLDFSHNSISSVSVVPADVTSVLKYSFTFWKFTFHHLRTFNCDHTITFYIKPLELPYHPESLKDPMHVHLCVG